jgi:hypothetical protein
VTQRCHYTLYNIHGGLTIGVKLVIMVDTKHFGNNPTSSANVADPIVTKSPSGHYSPDEGNLTMDPAPHLLTGRGNRPEELGPSSCSSGRYGRVARGFKICR